MSTTVAVKDIVITTAGELALSNLGYKRERITTNLERWHCPWNVPDTVSIFRHGVCDQWRLKFSNGGTATSVSGNIAHAALLRLEEKERDERTER